METFKSFLNEQIAIENMLIEMSDSDFDHLLEQLTYEEIQQVDEILGAIARGVGKLAKGAGKLAAKGAKAGAKKLVQKGKEKFTDKGRADAADRKADK